MDELSLLRSTRDDTLEPSERSFNKGRAALLASAAAERSAYAPSQTATVRRRLPRITWAVAGVATALTAVLVTGNINLSAQSAHASDVLQTAASNAIEYVEVTPGPGEYLYSSRHERYPACWADPADPSVDICGPNDMIIDLYKPADVNAEWVLYRDWGNISVGDGAKEETRRGAGGVFEDYGQYIRTDYDEIPLDAAAAYAWIDSQYAGGSASRDEDNFDRIATILRDGLVPAAPRAALLEALTHISGVSATEGVSNLNGIEGVAIGRNEPFRSDERREIIIDPTTGLIIGERTVAGLSLFGWNKGDATGLTSLTTTVVSQTP